MIGWLNLKETDLWIQFLIQEEFWKIKVISEYAHWTEELKASYMRPGISLSNLWTFLACII